jgi:tol-pal system protein YbgF
MQEDIFSTSGPVMLTKPEHQGRSFPTMTFFRFTAPILAGLMLAAPAVQAQDAADLLLRTNRLENQVRQLQGQIEQLQFQNRKLEDQLRKFQEDVEFRFQERGGPAPKSAATPPAPAAPVQGLNPAAPKQVPPGQKRGDAFDPGAQPNAPGAPRSLGTLPAGAGAAPVPPGTLPVPRAALPGPDQIGDLIEDEVPMDGADAGPLDLSASARGAAAAPGPSGGGAVTATALPPPSTGSLGAKAGDVPDEFEAAYTLVLQRQYDDAEMAFRSFLQGHPKDKMVPNALYWLGESYLRRNRYEDAAEQYLKIYQSHGQSKVAPDGLVKLATALRGMGQKEQACATLAEVSRKYPQATAEVRASVEREQKRTACAVP